MGKLVVLKLGQGNWDNGFPVILQMGEEGSQPNIEIMGKLPAAPDLPLAYHAWQTSYLQLGKTTRLEPKTIIISNVSLTHHCIEASRTLLRYFNHWLNAESFRAIREKMLEQISPSDPVRLILQTEDPLLQRLPWHLWDWFEHYPQAEIALSSPAYEQIGQPTIARRQVRILAILGNSTGINTEADLHLLKQLPDADIQFLIEPERQQLTEQLWDAQGWDILFFAGHSSGYAIQCPPHHETSNLDETKNRIYLNQTDSLTLKEMKYALKKAVEKGLKVAIFNSCDGLGLAQELADLHIPQILVMREPVPDQVAQTFLKYFLMAFSQGESFYLSVRQAREQLQGLEHHYPCATWLPVIYQNPAQMPPTWQALRGATAKPVPQTALTLKQKLGKVVLMSLAVTGLVLGTRHLGFLQNIELMAFDHLIQLRPTEKTDPRLLVVTITEADIQAQNPKERQGSLSDPALLQLLEKLEKYQPRVIGLDIYRDFPAHTISIEKQISQAENLIGVCKVSDRSLDDPGIAPPPEIPLARMGFSDFLLDLDGKIRRHLLALTPEPASPCQASYSFSVQVAFHYLASQGILPSWTPDENLQIGQTVFKNLNHHQGVYQNLETWGHQILLNYRAADPVAAQVSLSDILTGKVNPDAIRDRIILIGTTAPSFGDYWLTPYSPNHSPKAELSGVLLQAHLVSQILSAVLDKRPLLWFLPRWGDVLCIWGGAFIGGIIVSLRFTENLKKRLISIVVVSGGWYVICWFSLVMSSCWLPFIPTLLAIIGTSTLMTYLISAQNRSNFYEHQTTPSSNLPPRDHISAHLNNSN
ncbi:CHASE2 domain-containing protein [Chroococcus sp. FPU101]|uniref:CHASE2 domain-containing protein n=1 Tax=Chroococcus sp. FPU101 TaxID=1974212 RepID=UPI001A8DB46A|nr:CHASE2 domain-containing protein [Chroococcus sp. FPU101]GFE69291.1 putative Chase2 sensor protein [Chroococcus sp. FPU101]